MPDATTISVREVLARFETDFASTAKAVENAEFALWVGSGISGQAPNLGGLIERAFEFLRQKTLDPAFTAEFTPALDEAVTKAGLDPAVIRSQYAAPFNTWPDRTNIVKALWGQYSDLLDIRIRRQPADFVLWDAIDIRAAFADVHPPAATHLCIGILAMEGVLKTIASANWDGYIEEAFARLSNNAHGVLQVVVDPDQLRDAPSQTRLLKFHGCIVYATKEPMVFRKYLTGSRTQITEWPNSDGFRSMVNVITDVATNQKTMVMGLSIQDYNLQTIFSKAKQVNPWPWPCTPNAPGHVFCGDEITQGQSNVLKIVYGPSYDHASDEIQTAIHLRAWAEQVLLALVLKVLSEKLLRLMEALLSSMHLDTMMPSLRTSLTELRDFVADLATTDRIAFTFSTTTTFVNAAVTFWSRLLSLFRFGKLPVNEQVYTALSNHVPATVGTDANAVAARLGHFGLILATLYQGQVDGTWSLKLPVDSNLLSGSFRARANRAGASDRPLFIVKSASEAIELQQSGAFADNAAVVIHADEAWETLSNKKSARKPTSAPGRLGRIPTKHGLCCINSGWRNLVTSDLIKRRSKRHRTAC